MAITTANVPGVQHQEFLTYKVKVDNAVKLWQGVDWGATEGEVKADTTVNTGKCAGISNESCTAAETASGSTVRLDVQVHGVARFVAGADCSGSDPGTYLVFDDTAGRFKPCPTTTNTVFMTHGFMLNDPDTDGDVGLMELNRNCPYIPSVTT